MQLISLNTLCGFFFEPLMEFVKASAEKTDFFCFQEVADTQVPGSVNKGYRPNLFSELAKALPDFQGFFVSMHRFHEAFDSPLYSGENVSFGMAIFLKKELEILQKGSFFIHNNVHSYVQSDTSSYPHKLQYIQLNAGGRLLTVCNFYGTPRPGTKLDTPERILQSQKALDFLLKQKGEKIIAGDFNLLPETKSITMFEESGFRNLVKEFSIPTTRGSINKKMNPQYANTPQGFQEFADYAFISSGIAPLEFRVPDLPISDHLPLILDFKMK